MTHASVSSNELTQEAEKFLHSNNRLELLKKVETVICVIDEDCPNVLVQKYKVHFNRYTNGLFIEKEQNLDSHYIIIKKGINDRILVHEYLHAFIHFKMGKQAKQDESQLNTLKDSEEDINDQFQKLTLFNNDQRIKYYEDLYLFFNKYIALTLRNEFEEIVIEFSLKKYNKNNEDLYYLTKNCKSRKSFFLFINFRIDLTHPEAQKIKKALDQEYQVNFRPFCE